MDPDGARARSGHRETQQLMEQKKHRVTAGRGGSGGEARQWPDQGLSYRVGGLATQLRPLLLLWLLLLLLWLRLLCSQKGVQFLVALQKGVFLGTWASQGLQSSPETHIATTALVASSQ